MKERFSLKNKSCPICDQGRLFVMEDISNDRLFLHCEECECAWADPEEIIPDKSFLAINPDFETRKPNKEKIKKFGWEKYNLRLSEK